jgi:hypothetical protein
VKNPPQMKVKVKVGKNSSAKLGFHEKKSEKKVDQKKTDLVEMGIMGIQ